MPTNPGGALGSLDYKKEERRVLAVKSREAAPKYGTPERQRLIDEVCFHFVTFLFSYLSYGVWIVVVMELLLLAKFEFTDS